MKSFPVIWVWDGCHPAISAAVNRFQVSWEPYAAGTHRARAWHLNRLIETIIEPALSAFLAPLPSSHRRYVVGANSGRGLGSAIETSGFKAAAYAQHRLLKMFVATHSQSTPQDTQFIATLETLTDLYRACLRKGAKRPAVKHEDVKGRRINERRVQEFCRCCGALTEISAVQAGHTEQLLDDPEERLKLSAFYCSEHRPKLADGTLNPRYRSAMRSLTQFDQEVTRLGRQTGRRNTVRRQSDEPGLDEYYYRYVRANGLTAGDEAELRQHARLMVDARLTDHMKQILVLKHEGLNQSEIAGLLGMTRQAVSKILKAIPERFRELPDLDPRPRNYLASIVQPEGQGE